MRLRIVCLFVLAAALLAAASGVRAADEDEGDIYYPGDIVYDKKGSAVVFSHMMHVDGMGFGCDSCHTDVFEIKEFAAQDGGDFTMDAMNNGKYCGACHNGETAFSTFDFQDCARCHVGAAGKGEVQTTNKKVKGPPDTITLGSGDSMAGFRHESHEPFSCDSCHTSLFPMKKTPSVAKMDDIYAGGACGTCHNGETAFGPYECGICHPNM